MDIKVRDSEYTETEQLIVIAEETEAILKAYFDTLDGIVNNSYLQGAFADKLLEFSTEGRKMFTGYTNGIIEEIAETMVDFDSAIDVADERLY